jgi:hypothetical protein
MSTKLILPALAAFLTVLSLQGSASARGNFSATNDYRFRQTIKRFKARVPSDTFGSIGYRAGTPFGRSSTDVVSGVYFVGRDPDPNIRFQLLRDFR